MPDPTSGFLRAVEALSEAGVTYVIVGVGGINFYARTPSEAYATLDLDALLEPNAENLGSAIQVLKQLGYEFEVGGEPFLDHEDESALQTIVRNGASLCAVHGESGQLDLLLSVAGFSYNELASDSVTFRLADVPVRVGALEKLLRSKQVSGRAKDLEFLRAFEARASQGGDDS